MPFHPTQRLTAPRGERAQGDTLVDLHVVANDAGLANHDASPVIDEERLAHRGAGVDVDAGSTVCELAHDARDERHLANVQLVR